MITKKQMTKKQREIYDVLFEDLKKARKKGARIEPGSQSFGVELVPQYPNNPRWWDDVATKATVIAEGPNSIFCSVCAVGSHFYNKAGKTINLPKDARGNYVDYVLDVFAYKFGILVTDADALAMGFERAKEPRANAWARVGYRLAQDFLKWQEKNGV